MPSRSVVRFQQLADLAAALVEHVEANGPERYGYLAEAARVLDAMWGVPVPRAERDLDRQVRALDGLGKRLSRQAERLNMEPWRVALKIRPVAWPIA